MACTNGQERKTFEALLLQDLSHAVGVPPDAFRIRDIRAGSIIVDITIIKKAGEHSRSKGPFSPFCVFTCSLSPSLALASPLSSRSYRTSVSKSRASELSNLAFLVALSRIH